MNWLLTVPISSRLILLFLVGVVLGGWLNRGIYSLAWNRRCLGPWSPPPPDCPPRRASDWVPVCGWWWLRRESTGHGRGYWIRPLLLELATGLGLAGLYYWEVQRQALWPQLAGLPQPSAAALHAQYLSHVVLMALMTVATFIDLDEQLIPDEITVTGTALALVLAVALPVSLLPDHLLTSRLASSHHVVFTATTTSQAWEPGLGGPFCWPPELNGRRGLWLALLGLLGWYLAILHKTWTLRSGMANAIRYLFASLRRHNRWPVTALLVALLLLTWATWQLDTAGHRWQALFSAIVGMCAGGGFVWAVRIIGGHALRTEAMGFGDVTLMAMIGAFLGWQAAILTFFLAPVTAVAIAAAQRLLTGQQRIAFGPYLCLAATVVVVEWNAVWTHWAREMFALGWFMPIMIAGCLGLMGVLLLLWRAVRAALFGY